MKHKQHFLQSIGKAEKTKDEDFDQLFADFQQQQKDIKRLYNSLNKFFSNSTTFQDSSRLIKIQIEEFYEDCNDPNDPLKSNLLQNFQALFDSMKQFDKESKKILETVNAQIEEMDKTNQKIKIRNSNLLQFDTNKKTLQNLLKKKEKNLTKLPEAENNLQESEKIFNESNNECKKELLEITSKKHETISVPLKLLLNAQLEMKNIFLSLNQNGFNDNQMQSENIDNSQEDIPQEVLDQMEKEKNNENI
ncbi:bridging integrator 3 [Anaeramoeba ignava]|uniref:Bridging integrator 3 n=1 Tax=Anaeramoeba ignava TaxID=1746090 RepID=A0A9Q0L9C7_ANAIG|nr:bridging integrator 3 [Anaeramoeba ignava]